MMMNSEIFTSVMLDAKANIVVLDNRGFACIGRLYAGCGADQFNNLLDDGTVTVRGPAPVFDLVAHTGSMGVMSKSVADLKDFPATLQRARADVSMEGGSWWQAGLPEVSSKQSITDARTDWHNEGRKKQPYQ